ncbi:unnamed protein product [Nippostrongylus brasiliensis]|uniref:Uncharacterized protein n=1 Tax=Nippostrongylus brasiliensis TaxID=27835 RepID=A0A0N4XW12_NIPBR|nr:unnamed protein product [Nippostrongylus brasiliensis]
MQTAVYLLLLATAVYGKLGKEDASKMLEQPALRVRRSSEEDKVYEKLWDFIIALKLFGKSLGDSNDPFTDAQEEARKHWSQKSLDAENLQKIGRMLIHHLPQLENGVCIGNNVAFYKFHWCPNVVRKLGLLVYELYNLHYVLTKSRRLNLWYFGKLDRSIIEKAVWHYPTRKGLVYSFDIFLHEMQD